MLSTLSKARRKRLDGEQGFTLIELLVVVVILGILIAIAIPVYLNYRKSANDKAAQSDLRNAVSTMEICYSDNGSYYPGTVGTDGTMTAGTPSCSTQKITLSSGTTLTYKGGTIAGAAASTNPTAYIIEATNSGGSGKVYCYASIAGGSVQQASTTLITAFASSCPS